MIARLVRYGAALLALALAWVFLVPMFRPLPAAGRAGMQSGASCDGPTGASGRHEFTTRRGLKVSVVTPADYDRVHRYGLLVVLPPAGFSAAASERFYRLTRAATEAGYVVSFSQAVPLSAQAIQLQREAVAEVRQRWCIDPRRILLAGHSDGGSLAHGIVLRAPAGEPPAAAILASAAGVTQADLAHERCPAAFAVTLLHAATDERFPDYGRGVAQWWARCFGCAEMPATAAQGSCVDARQCRAGGAVRYCETADAHSQYPAQFGAQLVSLLQARRERARAR